MLYWLLLAAQRLAASIPQRVRWRIGGFVAETVYWLWPEKRRATQHNMSVILGLPITHPKVRRTARLSWRRYGSFTTDLFDHPNHPPSYFLARIRDGSGPSAPDGTPHILQALDEARAPGKGVLLVTGHYGNWDAAGILVASHAPLTVLAEAVTDERINRLLQEQRRAMGMSILMIEESLRPMMRLLREGGILATPIDRPVTPGEGVPVTFFGRTAYVPRGLGALAAKLGCAILPGFVSYDAKGQFVARIFPAVTITPSGDTDADIRRATQVMFDALEVMIREDPTQWYMFRPFWPTEDVVPTLTQPVAVQAAAHE